MDGSCAATRRLSVDAEILRPERSTEFDKEKLKNMAKGMSALETLGYFGVG